MAPPMTGTSNALGASTLGLKVEHQASQSSLILGSYNDLMNLIKSQEMATIRFLAMIKYYGPDKVVDMLKEAVKTTTSDLVVDSSDDYEKPIPLNRILRQISSDGRLSVLDVTTLSVLARKSTVERDLMIVDYAEMCSKPLDQIDKTHVARFGSVEIPNEPVEKMVTTIAEEALHRIRKAAEAKPEEDVEIIKSLVAQIQARFELPTKDADVIAHEALSLLCFHYFENVEKSFPGGFDDAYDRSGLLTRYNGILACLGTSVGHFKSLPPSFVAVISSPYFSDVLAKRMRSWGESWVTANNVYEQWTPRLGGPIGELDQGNWLDFLVNPESDETASRLRDGSTLRERIHAVLEKCYVDFVSENFVAMVHTMWAEHFEATRKTMFVDCRGVV